MSSYTLAAEVPLSYSETVTVVRDALTEQGFGIISEIDLSATLKSKLDVDLPPQLILGACRPTLAHQALLADPSIAAMLPCNVVVRSVSPTVTAVEAIDPAVMVEVGGEAIAEVARDAGDRLKAMLESISKEN